MKVALITLGCPKNLVDAEVMMGLLDEEGHELTGEVLDADVAVVNTCSFIAAAVEESRGVIEDCLTLKRQGTLGAVVVAGCLPQRYGEDTLRMFPDVDAVVGCSAFEEIAGALATLSRPGADVIVREPSSIYDHRSPRILGTPSHLAYVKIAEGCDNRCAYCTIPRIRGPLRSRDPDSVLAEAGELASMGVVELNVIAQDTTAYGTDIAPTTSLVELLRRLARVGVPWLRLLYTHPAHVTDELLSVLSDEVTLVPYLDVPIQHIADGVLHAMGRLSDGAQIRALLERARATVPGLTIRSSVMLGFPGETEADFEELLEFVLAGYVDHLGVFEFSPEPGTRAADLPGQIDREATSRRATAVHSAALRLSRARGERLLGSELEVLCDAPGAGRTAGQAWEMDGVVRWDPRALCAPPPGAFARVLVTSADGFDLEAVPLPARSGTSGG
ncbi:MAG: 30S ribosomal protein S12 methylthiotransferase RimO [Candidatus Eisenbacteria bacterium]